jgi:putative NAD(P)H nitroreductase
MSEFLNVVRERRSPNKFLEGVKIPREDFNEIMRDLPLAPSSFNLQHAHYYIVEDKDIKDLIFDASYEQYKIKTASAVIIITGDKDAYKSAEKIYEGSKMLGMIDSTEYDFLLNMIDDFHNRWAGLDFLHEEAIRNASLSAMQFMLLAKNKGWDTCPMIYFDKAKMKRILNIPENEEPTLMITMGKMDDSSYKVRGYRKAVSEFTKFF